MRTREGRLGVLLVIASLAVAVASPAPAPAEAAQTEPAGAGKAASVRGLVVMEAGDGQYHGKTVEIIAVPSGEQRRGTSVKIVSGVGKEMKIAFDEAVRLFKLRHSDYKGGIDVSFSDKYSAKDGGSAGAAFTVLLLSFAGDFETNPDAAMTGDITVDGKVRPVGAVAQKVHGAALDHCKLVLIPAANADAMDDAVLLGGLPVLWETQILSAATLDDAIAVMRKDPAPQLLKAVNLFDELKSAYAQKPAAELGVPEVRQKLAQILEMAPNHVSAHALKRVADGDAPAKLSPSTTISETIVALGPMRDGIAGKGCNTAHATPQVLKETLGRLDRVNQMADPTAAAAIEPMKTYCQAYAAWAEARTKKGAKRADYQPLEDQLQSRRGEAIASLQKLVSDPDFIDKVLHP
jgi:hypothetical protein